MNKKKPIKLSNIAISHISLVKAGANKKEIIYKSVDGNPLEQKIIQIKKSDDEKGIVYGIVYAPNEVDTDGEYAEADEIIKAAYSFMKNRNTTNIDKEHSLEIEKAYVGESWIIKENDSIFPDEPVGSWAVGIQLEDDELKKSVKDGEIAGISMFGKAQKEEVEPEVSKADQKSFSLNDMLDAFKKIFSSTSFEMRGHVYNDQANITKNKGEELSPEELEKAVKSAMEPVTKKMGEMQDQIDELKKSNDEAQEELKKSRQRDDVPNGEVKKDDKAGIL